MIFAYIKTLDNVHEASPPVACCVSEALAVVIVVCL